MIMYINVMFLDLFINKLNLINFMFIFHLFLLNIIIMFIIFLTLYVYEIM
jgi:hypothetical protein